MPSETIPFLVTLALLLAVVLAFLWRTQRKTTGRARPSRRALRRKPKNWILVDGSNVMHWQDNTPQIAPLLRVVEDLKARGFDPGVVFDANAGWKLFGRFMNEAALSSKLSVPKDQVLVVPKGTPAAPYILAAAQKFKAQIVTNDRYRDWAEAHPEVTKPGFLIRGGMRDGKVWLQGGEGTAKQVALA